MLPAIMLLSAAKKGQVSKLVDTLPKRYTHSDRIQNFATEKSQQIIAQGKENPMRLLAQLGFGDETIKSVNEIDGLRITLSDGRIIHLRPSGNAPELRCYSESDSSLQSFEMVYTSLQNIKN
jgi:phosphomannomutase